MKKSFRFFSCLVSVAGLILVSSATAQFAYDDAAPYTNEMGMGVWTDGMNLGFGFEAWTLIHNNAAGAFAGHFAGSSGVPAIDTNGRSFGMYANGDGYNYSAAYRPFTNALETTNVFKVKFKNAGISIGDLGVAGFSLRNSAQGVPTLGAGSASLDLASIVAASRFSFYFQGGNNPGTYRIEDGAGHLDTGIGYTSGGLLLEFALLDGDTYRLVIKNPAGATTLGNFRGRALGSIPSDAVDVFVGYCLDTGGGGDVHFNSLTIDLTSTLPPEIVNVQPADGSFFVPPSTNISFDVEAIFSGVAPSGIKIFLNGVDRSADLTITGMDTNRHAVLGGAPLQANVVYNVTITATDTNSNMDTLKFSFNTWVENLRFIEAEDYNYSSGGFLADPNPGEYGGIGLAATSGIDFLEFADAGMNPYRPLDAVDTEVTGDADHNDFAGQAITDYNLSFNQPGEWQNFTRSFSGATTYDVYARIASFNSASTMLLERHAASTATTANQPRAALGTFVANQATGFQNYRFIPLRDFFSSNVQVRLSGNNSLRATMLGGGYNFNYLLFVPATSGATLRPYLSAGFPFPGAGGVAPDALISFTIANRQASVVPGSIQLFLNAVNVTSGAILNNNSAGTVVTYQHPALLSAGTNTLRVVFTDNGVPAVTRTNDWQFTVSTLPVIPIALALPPSIGVSNGFTVRIAKARNNAPPELFPTSSQRAEEHLAGLIIDPDNLLPFENEAAGPGGNGLFAETSVINYNQAGIDDPVGGIGTFTNDAPYPYVAVTVEGSYTNDPNYISMAAATYLDLTAGIHKFAVRSDDGFRLTVGDEANPTNFLVADFEGGRDVTFASEFEFIVLTNGTYCTRLLHYEGEFGASVEWYSINRSNGEAILIGDPNHPNSIPAHRALSARIINVVRSGNTVTFDVISRAGLNHTVQYKNTLNDPMWQSLAPTFIGTGGAVPFVDASATTPSRFYQVVVGP